MSGSGGMLVPALLIAIGILVLAAIVAGAMALGRITGRLECIERRPDPVIPPYPPPPDLGPLQSQVTAIAEKVTRVLEVSRRLESLPDLLKPPKIRGGIGESLLSNLLEQILPPAHFETQYRLGTGAVVDAVVKLGDHLLPIDSKFPLESFDRIQKAENDEVRSRARREFVQQVRTHMDAVARYIAPAQGTLDLALMYIPAEAVYYETIVRDLGSSEGTPPELFEHAIQKKVIPVSPNTLYAHLQVILLGLRGFRVNEDARRIMAGIGQIRIETRKLQEPLDTLGKHLANAGRQQESVARQVATLGSALDGLLDRPAGPGTTEK